VIPRWWAAATVAALALAGCSGAQEADDAGPEPSQVPTSPSTTSATEVTSEPASPTPSSEPRSTRRLDSIAALGHSGITGYSSDPDYPSRDAHENSWATGQNPAVGSIYRRLLADHPSLRGHNVNVAIDGTGVAELPSQLDTLLTLADPLPDVVVVQTIDNDMRCDGTDEDNYAPFRRHLDAFLTDLEDRIPGVHVFLPSQWATVRAWTAWAADQPALVEASSGTGPCAVFDERGRPRPAGIRSMQDIVDGYWAGVERACAAHPRCWTDGGAEQERFVPVDRDVTPDRSHLSVAGHRKFAAIAWDAFPDEVKQMP
jgi:hypothetical protein